MTDKINEKVINLFSKNKKSPKVCNDGEVCENLDGYSYITMKADDNGRHFEEEALLTKANEFYYIVKVMVKKGKNPHINNYKISGGQLLEFIKLYLDGKGEGQIIEIDKFYPEEWA